MTVSHALQHAHLLPPPYLQDYVIAQEHFSAVAFLLDLTSGKMKPHAIGPAFAASEEESSQREAAEVEPLGEAVLEREPVGTIGDEATDRILLLVPTSAALEMLSAAKPDALGIPDAVGTLGRILGFEKRQCVLAVDEDGVRRCVNDGNLDSFFCVLPLDGCSSGALCENLCRAFFEACHCNTMGSTLRPVLLVVANMAIVAEAQVALARRAVDDCVAAYTAEAVGHENGLEDALPEGGFGDAFRPPHVVFVLHLAAEQLAFRPIYHTTSCDWQAVYVDDWGLSTNDSGTLYEDKLGSEQDDGNDAIDETPWTRMLFGVSDDKSQKAARIAFNRKLEESIFIALQRCKFPRSPGLKVPPEVVASRPAYEHGPPDKASAFIRDELTKRPYIFECLLNAFAVVWDEEILRIRDALGARVVHTSIVSRVKHAAKWLLTDFCSVFIAKHLSADWGLEAILAISPLEGLLEEDKIEVKATQDLISSILIGAAQVHREKLDTSTSHASSTFLTVRCDIPCAPHTPLFVSLIGLMRGLRAVVAASVGSEEMEKGSAVRGRAVAESVRWQEIAQLQEWAFLSKATSAIMSSNILQRSFVNDMVVHALQQFDASVADLCVYEEAMAAVITQLEVDGCCVLDIAGHHESGTEDLGLGEGLAIGAALLEDDFAETHSYPVLKLGPSALVLHEETLRAAATSIKPALRAYAAAAAVLKATGRLVPTAAVLVRSLREHDPAALASPEDLQATLFNAALELIWDGTKAVSMFVHCIQYLAQGFLVLFLAWCPSLNLICARLHGCHRCF